MNKTAISWASYSWNPVHGCSKVSDGCKHCYAMKLSLDNGWTKHDWTIQHEAENVLMKPHKLAEPYTLIEPQRVFTNSMSDLFHRAFPDWYRAVVFAIMLDLPQHIFQVLTKRSEALEAWDERFLAAVRSQEFIDFTATVKQKKVKAALERAHEHASPWADHIWQGVSVEDDRVLHRIDDLRRSNAHVRFISAEPLLGAWGDAVDLSGIHWVIVGGESGDHMVTTDASGQRVENEKRWMNMAWAREIKRLCIDQGTSYFFKQDSAYRTEQRKYLVEEDGSKWEWQQYPGALIPPREVGDPKSLFGNWDHKTEDASFSLRSYIAHLWENRAYQLEGVRAENAAIAAAWWYKSLEEFRPALPTEPHPGDDLEALRAGSDERIADTLAELVPDPDPIPPAPITKAEPDYADPFDLPLNAKVISLWQPWATLLMIAQGKRIETRSWQTPFKGTLVVHAAKKWDKDLQQIANSEPFASVLRANGYDPNALPLGAALGAVILDVCLPVNRLSDMLTEQERAFGDYSEGRYGWMTSRPRLFREPLPGEGGLGLRDWSIYLAKFKDVPSPNQPDEPPPTLFIDQFVIVPGKDPALYRGRIKKLANGEAMIAFNQQGDWIPYAEVQPHPDAVTTVHTARVDSRDPDVIDITVKSASTDIGKFFAPTWDMVNGVKSGKISEAQYTTMYEELLRSRYTTSASMLSNFLWERRRVVFTCYCATGEFCHRHLAVNVLAKIGMKFGFTVVNGGELEPPQPEAPSVQMSLFGDEVPAKKKTVYA